MTLEARAVRVSYPGAARPALDGISLRLEPGSLVAVAGANGGGKSTLCHVLAGAIAPDAGEVILDGCVLERPEPATVQLVQQSLEDHVIAPVVHEDVRFGPECLGRPDAEVAERTAEALTAAGLDGFDAREVTTLSGGELARLALAGALAMRPTYLLVDEPTAHLDPVTADRVMALLRQLADGGTGVLAVSHRLVETRTADRLVVLRAGEVIGDGPPRALLYDRPLLDRAGLAAPPIVRLVEEARAAGRDIEGAPLDVDELRAATGFEAWPASV